MHAYMPTYVHMYIQIQVYSIHIRAYHIISYDGNIIILLYQIILDHIIQDQIIPQHGMILHDTMHILIHMHRDRDTYMNKSIWTKS